MNELKKRIQKVINGMAVGMIAAFQSISEGGGNIIIK